MNGVWTWTWGTSPKGAQITAGELLPNEIGQLHKRLEELNLAGKFFAQPTERQLAFARGELVLICHRGLQRVALIDAKVFMKSFKPPGE